MRIFQQAELKLGLLSLDEKASHHLARVLRAEVGDDVTIFNGQGGEYRAVIREIRKKVVEVELLEFIDREVESPAPMVLAQGLARGEKMDFIIQKAVELGVNEIYPLITERCNVKFDAEREQKRMQHWQAVIISACEQSGRNRIPVIHVPESLSAWLPKIEAKHKFVLSPHVTEKLTAGVDSAKTAILVGPEGGLSDAEVETAMQQGFLPLSLGKRVLRTETAALAALAVLQFVYGDY